MIINWRFFSLLLTIPVFSVTTYYTVPEYIEFLANSNGAYKQSRLQIKSAHHRYEAQRGMRDWSMNHTIFSNHQSPYQTSSFTPEYVDSFGTYFSLSRPILSTGGHLSLSLDNQRIKQSDIVYNGLSFSTPLFYQSAIDISYTQPLLAGFGGSELNFPILQASENASIQTKQALESVENTLLSDLTNYVEWMLQHEITELNYARMQLAREAFEETKNRVAVNLSETIDLLRSEDAVQRALQQWLLEKAVLKSIQKSLSVRIGDPLIMSKQPKFELYDSVFIKKPAYIPLEQLRLVKQFSNQIRPLSTQLTLQENRRYGQLNLVGSYAFIGDGVTFSDSLEYAANNASIALQYSRPLSDIEQIETIQSTQAELDRLELQKQQTISTIASELHGLYTLIEAYTDILNVNHQQILTAEKKATAEHTLYKQGRSSIDIVISAQDNVLTSKLSYAQLSAKYQLLVLQYKSLTDTLMSDYGVEIQ